MIAVVAIAIPIRQTYEYLIPEDMPLLIGSRVKIPFRRKETIGVVLDIKKTTDFPVEKLKPITELLDASPIFSPLIFKLCQWAADYYQHPIGEVFLNALPVLLRQGKPAEIKTRKGTGTKRCLSPDVNALILNDMQRGAIDSVLDSAGQFQCFLLNGVTGSGKTEVYLQVIDALLKQEKQALVLVPEISLTPQTISRFQRRFNDLVVCFHSKMTNRERLNAWLQAKSGEAKIIIGTRSAIFTPCENLGVIIIDEEHDLSFKQHEGFRYSARDLAIVRAQMENIPIVLGSATPSLESLFNVKKKRYQELLLPERAGIAVHPTYRLIDVRDMRLEHGLSKPLLSAIEQKLKNSEQVMIFLNRRGYSPTLMCHTCGYVATCKRCDVHMTLHQNPKRLHCHHCDARQPVMTLCPVCNGKHLGHVGVGTERLEEALVKQFPDYPVIRVDRDTTSGKNVFDDLLESVNKGNPQILVGTQMLAKGHHFPNVTLVGVVNVDSGFFSSDFRAVERIGQLLIQVSGRAGRAEKPGEVLIQTFHPDHPLLLTLIKKDYLSFAKLALRERRETGLPPFSYFALIRAEAISQKKPIAFLAEIKQQTEQLNEKNVFVMGPIPSAIQRKKNHFRSQLLIQSNNRKTLQQFLKTLIEKIDSSKASSQIRWSVDVDPVDMG